VADYEPPEGLIAAQRAYYEADAAVQEVTASLPSGIAIAAGEAAITPEQRAALDAARAERGRLVDALYAHPWFETVDDPHAARMELQRRARG
jgi:hypothetical protein